MYKYTDLTYPQFFAVSADYSLFFATGLVTFRFEFVSSVDSINGADYFKFVALYKNRERVHSKDVVTFDVRLPRFEPLVSFDRFRAFAKFPNRECGVAVDLHSFFLSVRFRDRPVTFDVFSCDVTTKLADRSVARSRVSFRVSQKFSVSVGVADSFKIGRGSVWRDRTEFEENARVSGVIRLFDRSYLSEYLKVKGERQREGDSVGSIDSFSVVVFACASEFILSADSVVIKNPDSASFVLGATSPSDTALGGRLYV